MESAKAWAIGVIADYVERHMQRMLDLATTLALTDVWLAHENDEGGFDWAAHAKFISDNGAEKFNNYWQVFEACNRIMQQFCTNVRLDETNIERFNSVATQLEQVRLAVVSCAFIECVSDDLAEGDSVASSIRQTRCGLNQMGLMVPACMSTVVRHMQVFN